jgi:hypothetical protein
MQLHMQVKDPPYYEREKDIYIPHFLFESHVKIH